MSHPGSNVDLVEDTLITNRELASLVLLGLFTVYLVLTSNLVSVLEAFGGVLKTLFTSISFPVMALYVGWVLLSLLPAWRLGLWDESLWKPTILWVVLAGFGLFFSLGDAVSKPGWFRRSLLITLASSAFIEFFATLKSFPLWVEIPLQPILILMVVVRIVAKPNQEPVRWKYPGVTDGLGVGFMPLGWSRSRWG